MQLLMSFAQVTPSKADSVPDIWPSLPIKQREEAIAVLARLLTKTAKLDQGVEQITSISEREK